MSILFFDLTDCVCALDKFDVGVSNAGFNDEGGLAVASRDTDDMLVVILLC